MNTRFVVLITALALGTLLILMMSGCGPAAAATAPTIADEAPPPKCFWIMPTLRICKPHAGLRVRCNKETGRCKPYPQLAGSCTATKGSGKCKNDRPSKPKCWRYCA